MPVDSAVAEAGQPVYPIPGRDALSQRTPRSIYAGAHTQADFFFFSR